MAETSKAKFDFSGLTLKQLQKLEEQIKKEISRKDVTKKQDLVRQMRKIAEAGGFTLEDVVGFQGASAVAETKGRGPGKGAKPAKKKGEIRFRSKDNPQLGWTGHGRKPGWVNEWLGNGGNLDDLRV